MHLADSKRVGIHCDAPFYGRLTPRQREVLLLVAGGHTDDDIARELTISPHTAGHHIRNIFNRLGAATRAHAVAIAFGVVEPAA